MTLPRLENRMARALFMDRHALAESPAGPAKGSDLGALIHRLGFVQLDSINTVARAHDLILFSRRPSYRAENLKRHYEQDKALFEHWTHDAAVIPMSFYPHWHLRFQRDAELLRKRWRNWRRDGFEAQYETVLQHIQTHGPVSSSDVGKDEKKVSGGWWDWHPSKTALEYLWRSGALTVIGREGFQKRYDLTERVIEQHLCPDDQPCDAEPTIDWLCNAALDRLGFATSGELAAFWDTASTTEARAWCTAAEGRGEIQQIEVENADGSLRKHFARPNVLDSAASAPAPPNRIRVLSPFDPALRDRKRAERLFGFHYRIEVFVPAPKRTYGYYVFPLLEGNKLVGRIDMKAYRDRDTLIVRALWPERNIKWSPARTKRLESELDRVRRFIGLGQIEFGPDWLCDPK
ncbi:winged helix-turn-helix domain-containing protein [Phaeobacter gallaeciensis]|uniref:Winged helix-turn-helix domain-containing protein n=2 Tax=Roseobacteraceae TaxID=2854170 RepID=A0A366WVG3_9RHOB|nr:MULTISPECIES: crosslink repair DNA glycosylase YcaQ family protein [Roseobacteraceae]MBT3142018.1 winged helix DNA-binding domain-containing protein [Falsiruegeria litorea]MBT8168636.1 winged helix DNA-binding domain-containing protein [Falsiruegeria litorea]RBW53894.1 winged helix-turn-helix domain-containing protein [Phaeobacter gallaeciensis]